MEKLTVKIDGMSCGMCDAHVNNLVRKHFNVKKVKANHSKGIAEIITEDNMSDEALREALGEMGYKVLEVERAPYEKKGFFRW